MLSPRDDLVQLGVGPTNHSLTVRTVNVGLTLLALWDTENMGVADYVPLPVEHAIHMDEANELVVGDVVCFQAKLTNRDGKWCTPYNKTFVQKVLHLETLLGCICFPYLYMAQSGWFVFHYFICSFKNLSLDACYKEFPFTSQYFRQFIFLASF